MIVMLALSVVFVTGGFFLVTSNLSGPATKASYYPWEMISDVHIEWTLPNCSLQWEVQGGYANIYPSSGYKITSITLSVGFWDAHSSSGYATPGNPYYEDSDAGGYMSSYVALYIHSDGSYATASLTTTISSHVTTPSYVIVTTERITYQISYAAGSSPTGSGSVSGSRGPDTKTHGTQLALPGVVFSFTGYTQTGWTTSSLGSQTHSLGGNYTTEAAQTFYPVWTINTYSVSPTSGTFTGGSWTAPSSVNYGGTLTVSITLNAGYQHHATSDMSVSKTGGGTNTRGNTGTTGTASRTVTFSNITSVVTNLSVGNLAIETFNISYQRGALPTGGNSFGSQNSFTQTKNYGQTHYYSSTVFTVTAGDTWTQAGWTTDNGATTAIMTTGPFTANGSTTFNFGAGYTGNSGRTLYPVWVPKANTFQFRPGTNSTVGAITGSNPGNITRYFNVTTANFPNAVFSVKDDVYKQIGWTTEGTVTGSNGVVLGYGGTVAKSATRIAISDSFPGTHELSNASGTAYTWYPIWALQSNVLNFYPGANPADSSVAGPADTHYKIPNVNFDLTTVTKFTAVGYTHVGWTTTNNLIGGSVVGRTSYIHSPDIQTANSNVNYYPIWKPDEYIITYHSGLTDASETQIKYHGEDITLKSVAFYANGLAQVGWSLTNDGVLHSGLGTLYKVNAPLILYPVWQIGIGTVIVHNISHLPITSVWAFDPSDSETLKLASMSAMPPNFDGWYLANGTKITQTDGSGRFLIPTPTPGTTIVHIYAKWV